MPGDGKAVDFFQLFITVELLGKIAAWTNHWVKVKQQLEPGVSVEISIGVPGTLHF